MTRLRWVALFSFAGLMVGALEAGQQAEPPPKLELWRAILADRVALFGHRNWIVVADSAYPAQVSPGIETVVTHADHLEVLRSIFKELARHKHIRPIVTLDSELAHIPERDANGISEYKRNLRTALGDLKSQTMAHEQIIDRLDKAGSRFRVLILKTELAIPYTSVFLELDCGYWSPEAERRLRTTLGE